MSAPPTIHTKPERLESIVEECLGEATAKGPLATRPTAAIARQFAAGLPLHPLDRALIKEAIGILLAEAATRASLPRRLRVTVKANRNALMFAVKSPGAGLDESQREVLFKGESRPGTPARARAIIAAHGGVTWANGEPGRGITFYFSLPIRRAAAPSP